MNNTHTQCNFPDCGANCSQPCSPNWRLNSHEYLKVKIMLHRQIRTLYESEELIELKILACDLLDTVVDTPAENLTTRLNTDLAHISTVLSTIKHRLTMITQIKDLLNEVSSPDRRHVLPSPGTETALQDALWEQHDHTPPTREPSRS